MRWYVSRNNETSGPFTEEDILQWGQTGQILPGMHVQAETGGPWMPVEQSPFAAFVVQPPAESGPIAQATGTAATPKPERMNLASVGLAVAAGALLLLCVLIVVRGLRDTKPETRAQREVRALIERTEQHETEAKRFQENERQNEARARAERAERGCRLHTPTAGSVPVFPTEDGLDEWLGTLDSKDENAMPVALLANGGFLVDAETSCHVIDLGFSKSKIRVTSGQMIGRSGYVLTEWTR